MPMWDERIDAVAHQLTAQPPRADLRARVLARIETGGRLRAQFGAWRMAPIAIGIAVIVLAVLRAGWHSRQTPANVPSAPPVKAAMTAVSAAPVTTGTPSTPRLAQTERVQPAPWQNGIEDSIEPVVVAPLALDGLRLDRIKPPEMIQPKALAVEPISVAPIALDELPHD